MKLTTADKNTLKEIAKTSIEYGLRCQRPYPVDLEKLTPALKEIRATFVTLKINDKLRGCIGTLTARTTLAQDVSDHAFAAAFQDPRFPALQKHELAQLAYHISILSLAEPMNFINEEELLHQIRPGRDGLILEDGIHRATFLPSVWESLPDKQDFLNNLKLKAGLPENYWSKKIKVSRYECEDI